MRLLAGSRTSSGRVGRAHRTSPGGAVRVISAFTSRAFCPKVCLQEKNLGPSTRTSGGAVNRRPRRSHEKPEIGRRRRPGRRGARIAAQWRWNENRGAGVKGVRRFHYVNGDRVKVGSIDLLGLPLAAQGEHEPIGRLDGLLIDVVARRVHYLVVRVAATGRRALLPLDATSIDARGRMLTRVSSDIYPYDAFDASAFPRYDDDAVISLLFGQPSARPSAS